MRSENAKLSCLHSSQALPSSILLPKGKLRRYSLHGANTSCPGRFLNINVQFVVFQGNVSWIASCSREVYLVFKMVLHVHVIYEYVLLVKIKTTQSHRVEVIAFSLLSLVSLNPLPLPLEVTTANNSVCLFQAFSPVCLYTCRQVRREAATEQYR